MYCWLITNCWLILTIAHTEQKSSKLRRLHAAEAELNSAAEYGHLAAVISGILRSTKAMEFSASVAGAGTSLPEFISCSISD